MELNYLLVNRFNRLTLSMLHYGHNIKIIFLYYKTSDFGYDTEFSLVIK